jgi:hypothetical protein
MTDPQMVTPSKYLWGASYFLDYDAEGTRTIRNYFMSEIENLARYAVPFVKNIDLLMDEGQKKQPETNEPVPASPPSNAN